MCLGNACNRSVFLVVDTAEATTTCDFPVQSPKTFAVQGVLQTQICQDFLRWSIDTVASALTARVVVSNSPPPKNLKPTVHDLERPDRTHTARGGIVLAPLKEFCRLYPIAILLTLISLYLHQELPWSIASHQITTTTRSACLRTAKVAFEFLTLFVAANHLQTKPSLWLPRATFETL